MQIQNALLVNNIIDDDSQKAVRFDSGQTNKSKNNDSDIFEVDKTIHNFDTNFYPTDSTKRIAKFKQKSGKNLTKEEIKDSLNFDEFELLDEFRDDKDETFNEIFRSDTKSKMSESRGEPSVKKDELLGDFIEPIKKQSNKERSRKARQRKKKYYEDLESLNLNLQKQVDKLTKEVEYYKQKLKALE